ncbi:MAG: penicillin-binding transpeptidase domain-containing protein, partial [Trebonia sp.]
GPVQGPRRPGDPRPPGASPGLQPDRATGPGARLPQDRPAGPVPRVAADRSSGPIPRVAPNRSASPRAPEDRSTGPGKRLPPNARVPLGERAARPDPAPRSPRGSRRQPLRGGAGGGPRRPRRPPRWLTVKRGEPGRRAGITLLTIAIVLTLFAGRLVQLQGTESAYYKSAAAAEQVQVNPLPALRGTIYGSNGQPLAMTLETYTVTADPPLIPDEDKPAAAQDLAGPLGLSAAKVLDMLRYPKSFNGGTDWVKFASGVSTTNEARIAAYDIPGIDMTPTFVRDYPDGSATANLVGFTNVNQGVIKGVAGIEQEYNSLLTGTTGSEQVMTNPNGVAIPLAGTEVTPAKDGESIRLTINPTLQFQAQQACQQEVAKTKAANCSVVVMQPKTGAILAMAQWPTYDQDTFTNVDQTSDIPDSYMFDPGSTAKVITAAAAFEHGGQTPMSPYNIPYVIYRGGQAIHDAEYSYGEKYTIAGIIANSSNVGMSQVVSHVSPQVQYDYLRAFGLGEPTGLGLPSEQPSASYPGLAPPSQWAADERYTLSYGQGISVNAVQMASVYATIANDGVRVQPTLVAGTYNAAGQYVPARAPKSTKVIQPQTAKELIQILQQVPGVDNEADQRWGDIAGYAIAAKTGTSSEPASAGTGEKPCPASNPLCVHGSSYIGMAPGNDPQVVVAVNVQNPDTKTDYFGDEVAGPVFYSVMNSALQTQQIQPQPGLVAPYVRLNAR